MPSMAARFSAGATDRTIMEKRSRWTRIYRGAWLTLVVLCLAGAASIILPRYNRLRAMQEKKLQLQRDNAKLEARLQHLRDQQHRFETDPAFIERLARERGKIKPHEKTFRIADQKPTHEADQAR